MAVTHTFYDTYLRRVLNGQGLDLDDPAVLLKVALLKTTHTPNLAAHDFFNDVVADEIPATGGYTARGLTIPSRALGLDTATHYAYLDGGVASWSSFTATGIGYAVLYVDTGTDATSPLVTLVDFGVAENPAGVTFSLVWSAIAAGGILSAVRG